MDTGIRIIRINMQVLMGMDIGEIWKCYKSGKEGTVDQTVISTRIPFKAVKGKAFVIHAMPDNFTDLRSMEEAVPVCMLPLFRDYNDYFNTDKSFTRNSMDHFCNLVAGIFPYFCIEQMIKEYGSYLSALCAYTYSCRRLWAYS